MELGRKAIHFQEAVGTSNYLRGAREKARRFGDKESTAKK